MALATASVIHHLEFAEIWVDPSSTVIHVHISTDDYTRLDNLNQLFNTIEELCKYKKAKVIVHNVSVHVTTPEIRRAIRKRGPKLVSKAAVVAPNQVFQMIYFMLRYITGRTGVPYQMFTSEDAALQWLKED